MVLILMLYMAHGMDMTFPIWLWITAVLAIIVK